LDAFIETLIEPWNTVRANWEDHARYLFHAHSTVYRILQEAAFANDEGGVASDSILVEVQRQSAHDCIRRPVRIFQKSNQPGSNDEHDGEVKPNFSVAANNSGGGNPNKEAVTECMGKKKFVEVVRIIHPTMPIKQVSKLIAQHILRVLTSTCCRRVD
jgi:hypothetical protein